MMIGVPAGLMGGGGAAMAAGETHESGGASGGSSEVGGPSPTTVQAGGGVGGAIEESDRSGGNRWPRQETLALLKIRSDMGAVFRDANLKGPLWEDVSRKMAELGFHRSAKKCKEKFENVYKYHKRTKDGRASKPDSKSYRFFDQLEAFETTAAAAAPTALQIPSNVTVSASTSPTPLSVVPPMIQNNQTSNFSYPFLKQSQTPPAPPPSVNAPFQAPSSSSTSSDEDIQRRQRGKKRKWKEYLGRLMREVVQRQEELQNKFLDALERAERDRTAREDAWRAQETARMRRERDLLLQERSMTEAKDTAVIAFLKKMTNDPNIQISVPNSNNINVPHHRLPVSLQNHNQPPPPLPLSTAIVPIAPQKEMDTINGGDGFIQASSSRWPKAEVEALIKLRTNLDTKYLENGPKGPLWEEISGAMAKLGYSRNPKRCKEKWENINKYYKKVKESNRKRPEDSKTCPYFQLLEEIYKKKAVHNSAGFPIGYGPKPDDPMAPIMARPEQQWPSAVMNDDNDQSDPNNDDDDDDEDDDGGGYEMIPNKPSTAPPSPVANTAE